MKTKFSGILTLLLAFVVQLSFAQEKTISGTISDETGLPLPGVNIVVEGTGNGTQTDFDGKYSISTSTGSVINYSFVGYKTVTKTVGSANNISFGMEIDASGLDEVVIVAYGSEKASNVTSAISVVKAEAIEQVPNASLDQVLQGKAAGLNIQTSSGQPGASGTIRIRGTNSVQGNIEPLFVIDGVPVNEDNFRSLNSNDIESVSILKDASASALYGNRAAGGVVIVTTKSGKKGSGTRVQYRSLYGVSENIDPNFELMNSQQYLTLRRANGFNSFSDAEIEALSNQTNTKWEDFFFRTGKTLSHEVNISTGGENSSSYNSIAYFDQEGVTKRSNIKRFTLRSNTSSNLNDRLSVNTNLILGYTKNNFSSNPGTGQLDNPFINAYIGNPALNPYNPDGTLDLYGTGDTGFANSPIVALNQATLNTSSIDELKIVGRVAANLEVVDNISVGGSVGMDFEQQKTTTIVTPGSLRGINDATDINSINKGSYGEGYTRTIGINVNSNISYKNVFNEKHDLEVSLFTEYFKEHFDRFRYTGYGLDPKLIGSGNAITPGLSTEQDGNGDDQYYYIPDISNYAATNGTVVTTYDSGLFSYFGVVKYDYDNKYGAQVSLRRDASSRFNKTNKWGTFYSISGKWNIHNEPFMQDSNLFSELKLRGSYGTTGNDEAAARFGSFSLYTLGTGYNASNGYFLNQIENPDLKWETVVQTNFGLDFRMVDNRLNGTIDVYKKVTEDLFLNQPLSRTSGQQSIAANVGEMENKGVELSLSYDLIRSDDRKGFNLSVNGNVALNENKIISLVGDGLIETGRTVLSEGDAFGSFYAVRWAGVNPNNGSPLYLDKDGLITDTYSDDDRVILDKSFIPKYTGGFGVDMSYKNFSLNTLFSFAAEQYRNNGSIAVVEDPSLISISNQSVSILNEWQTPGQVTDIPSSAYGSTRLLSTDRYIEDASFLRLRNVTLSYSLDKEILERTKLFTGIRVYAQAQNLLTFSKWRGFDPESNISSTFFEFPTPRTFSVGFDVNF
ncbi:TonB-dependent receptor [Lacinutrix sp. MedPE-SW]|uniref:SusC/RagA family TonB-linked outer membrane protein n=1 Tax=Lacinutrix sp. MedPE-SW TaxID=1860087 RepID=UPI0009141291|nr:TonB-dependent receptor [Lacinutrix sp. MedPE-SW]OIQ21566.1 MAG: hypothetical protein BM549_08980 [Lacinutrix sp. MedPE-SW]